MDEGTMRAATQILARFVSDVDAKVRYGLRLRNDYFAAVERGEEPNDYRSNFMSKASIEIFSWLEQKCQEFAQKFPQDRMSSEDLKDILVTAHGRILAREKKG